VATDPRGYVNAVEARIPHRVAGITLPARLGVAVASGLADGSAPRLRTLPISPNVANVAFRSHEPSRDWWDRQQGLTLAQGTVDPFFAAMDLGALAGGATRRYLPGPGYHDRIFPSSPRISKEAELEGVLQHYGVYLPSTYRPPHPSPLQMWFHFRGGTAHIAAAVIPRVFKDLGEDVHTIVVSPRGRGTSTWYVGKGHQDWLEVWNDVHHTFSVDRRRTYIAGHSMGGWATYLLTLAYPDRFAAGLPASAPPTQGAWTGVDFDHCDEFETPDGEKPCYTSANGGDPRAELTRPLLDNIREIPLAIYQGAADELVPVSGVVKQVQRLQELRYRYRFYVFPHQEHYGPPIQDQWAEGSRYEHSFVQDPNPAHVTYIRSRPFERAIERVQSDGVHFDFDLAQAYWMSGLDMDERTNLVSRFDGRSLAIRERPHDVVQEAGGPAQPDQSGPYAMTGEKWVYRTGPFRPLNAFEFTLTNARGITLDLARMRIDVRRRITGTLTTNRRLLLTLRGHWPRRLAVSVNGHAAPLHRRGRRLVVALRAGHDRLAVRPR
jgi:pimeloyl-ACP methyl ester carboxylesterase